MVSNPDVEGLRGRGLGRQCRKAFENARPRCKDFWGCGDGEGFARSGSRCAEQARRDGFSEALRKWRAMCGSGRVGRKCSGCRRVDCERGVRRGCASPGAE